MIELAEIEKMSQEERLQTLEQLWDVIRRDPESVPSPDWHGEVLAAREGKAEYIPWEEAKKSLRPPLK